MNRSYTNSNQRVFLSLFYVVSLFAITFMMIHFIQYNSDKKIPSMDNFKTVVIDDVDPLKKPLPPYDYNALPPCNLEQEVKNARLDVKEIHKSFLKCVIPLFARFIGNPEGILFNFHTAFSVCDEEKSTRDIEIRDFGINSWTVLPTCKENNTLVTFGVGKDTSSEHWLLEKLPNLEMYGTSGTLENSSVYKHFYNFAIGEGGETVEMEVLENGELINKTLPQKEFGTFMTDLKLTKIDTLWINLYYGKFPFWEYLTQDGWMSKNRIIVCQMIIEVPKNHGRELIRMILPMEKNSNFIFIRPTTTNNGGARAFFINYKDPQCTRKYLE